MIKKGISGQKNYFEFQNDWHTDNKQKIQKTKRFLIFYANYILFKYFFEKLHEMINWNKNLYFFAKNVSFLNYAFKVKMWVGFGFYEVGWTFVRRNCLLSQFQVAGLSKFTKLSSLSKMAFQKILLPFGFDRNLTERLEFEIV